MALLPMQNEAQQAHFHGRTLALTVADEVCAEWDEWNDSW
jgi:hypothetical protein